MKTIPLTRGKFAIIDEDDYDRVVAVGSWSAHRRGDKWYAYAHPSGTNSQTNAIAMHRFVLGAGDGCDTDHRNGDGLDNQKKNLRPATRAQNMRNCGKRKTNTTGFKGVVAWRKGFAARITVDYKLIHIGSFKNKIDAAKAYDAAAKIYHGEFARTNFS